MPDPAMMSGAGGMGNMGMNMNPMGQPMGGMNMPNMGQNMGANPFNQF